MEDSAPLTGYWKTWQPCPLCRQWHELIWPHQSAPSPRDRLVFECPAALGRVVLPGSVPWGEMTASTDIEEPLLVELFYL
jgi:hypothetical protein